MSELFSFWLPAALLISLVALLVFRGWARALVVPARDPATEARDSRAGRVYAEQIKEIERDVARGVVTATEAERLRTEVARRLLDSDRAARGDLRASPPAARWVVLGVLALLVPVTGLIYATQGAPLYRDFPLAQRHAQAAQARAERMSQVELEAAWAANPRRLAPPPPDAQYAALMEQLRDTLATRPLDLQGHRLLAANEANLGNHAASAAAMVRVIEIQGEGAPVEDLVALAEQMVLAAGGVVSPEADAVLERVLRRDPQNLQARYYTGLMLAQTGRADLTFRLWSSLLTDSPADAPWVTALRETLPELAQIAGVPRYTLPPEGAPARGPTAADMEAAAEMTDDERREMIGGMVEGLAARLANQGGSAEDWARLIGALGVLGETDRARAIWGEARLMFTDRPDDLGRIRAAAQSAGVAD
jgi:cytochrome c-type biogenesis protein CcmH